MANCRSLVTLGYNQPLIFPGNSSLKMIDLHCHMLPAIDDGSKDLEMSLEMAGMAVADGITHTVCTPHIYPGWFENTASGIKEGVSRLQEALDVADIHLKLLAGADIQVVPDLVDGLQTGALPTIHGSRYFLFEPPHNTRLPGIDKLIHQTVLNGYVPIITHPERLSYIDKDYELFAGAALNGAWIQLTGGSLLGEFGSRARDVSRRLLADGFVHVLASDGHNLDRRAPVLRDARASAAEIVGETEASRLVFERPEAVIANEDPGAVTPPPGASADRIPSAKDAGGWLSRLFKW